MKWSAVVAAGLGIAAVGAVILAVAMLVGYPIYGVVVLSLGAAVALMGGTMYFAEKN